VPKYNPSIKHPFINFSNYSNEFSGLVDQWFVNIEFTPQSENNAASYMGCSPGTKCLDVITDLSTKFLKLFILSKIIIALHCEKIESSDMKFGGNL
jgi:hypothetical protein